MNKKTIGSVVRSKMPIITCTQDQNETLVSKLTDLLRQNEIVKAAEALENVSSVRDVRDTAACIRQAVAEEETARLAARPKKAAKAGA